MEGKGFFGSLFDLSFTEFITTRIIKLLFILAIIGSGLGALGIVVTASRAGGAAIALGIILAPIVFFLYVLCARIWLELIIVIFRIAENTGRLVEQGKQAPGGGSE